MNKLKHCCTMILVLMFLTIGASAQFIPNEGQYPNEVHASLGLKGAKIFILKDRLRIRYDEVEKHDNHHQAKERKSHTIDYHFQGADLKNNCSFKGRTKHYYNFFIGDERKNWKSKIYGYEEMTIHDLYKGVDLHMFLEDGQFKYELIIADQEAFSKLNIKIIGADQLKIQRNGLLIKTSVGDILDGKPFTYYLAGDKKVEIKSSYKLNKDELSFKVNELNNWPIVIDPVLIFSTFSGSQEDNWGFSACNDSKGNAYSAGNVFGIAYQFSTGSYDSTFNLGEDILIAKFDQSGSNLLYYTYLGGNNKENPFSINVDNSDNLILCGFSLSPNFPAKSYDSTYNGGADIIVCKLSEDGTQLLGSTYLGGAQDDGYNGTSPPNINPNSSGLNYNYGDIFRADIHADSLGNIYLVCNSKSDSFPTTPNAYQKIKSGAQDAVIVSLDSTLNTLQYSTFLGGSGDDALYSMVLNEDGSIFACGGTLSDTLLFDTSAYQQYNAGGIDGWIIKLSKNGDSLLAGTFYGGAQYDQSYLLQKDLSGSIHLFGQSTSQLANSPNKYSSLSGKHFICKISSDLRRLNWQTRFGTGGFAGPVLSPTSFLVDNCQERIFVTGWGGSVNSGNPLTGNTRGMFTTPNAIQTTTDGSDLYILVLEKDASNVLFASFLGGPNSQEHVDGGTSRFDKEGFIFHAVCAGCGGNSDFPTSNTAYSKTNNSSNCNMLVFKMDLEFIGISGDFNWNTNDTCPPFNVNFISTASRTSATKYNWSTINGQQSVSKNPSFTFPNYGTYNVQLILKDTTERCSSADTINKTINFTRPSIGDFQFQSSTFCAPDSLRIISAFSMRNDWTINWSTSDGQTSLLDNPSFFYDQKGVYTITLFARHKACGFTQQIKKTFRVRKGEITSEFILNPSALPCAPFNLELNNSGQFEPGATFEWYLNGMLVGQDSFLNYLIDTSFVGELCLISLDSNFCNVRDTFCYLLNLVDSTRSSSESFCACVDDDRSFVFSMNPTHQFLRWEGPQTSPNGLLETKTAGNYIVYSIDGQGCKSSKTFSLELSDCFVDVPNIITPNGDGKNEVFFPELSEADVYRLQIFNRWGNLIYEKSSRDGADEPWDGTIKNKGRRVSPGTYYYILEGEFCNGKLIDRRGALKVIYN